MIQLARIGATRVESPLDFSPAWGFDAQRVGEHSSHRTLSGWLFSYPWERHSQFRLPLTFVTAGQQAVLLDWWREGATLLFSTDVSLPRSHVVCRLDQRQQPLPHRMTHAASYWGGILILNALDSRQHLGLSFVLDDAQWGRLDDPNLSLI